MATRRNATVRPTDTRGEEILDFSGTHNVVVSAKKQKYSSVHSRAGKSAARTGHPRGSARRTVSVRWTVRSNGVSRARVPGCIAAGARNHANFTELLSRCSLVRRYCVFVIRIETIRIVRSVYLIVKYFSRIINFIGVARLTFHSIN